MFEAMFHVQPSPFHSGEIEVQSKLGVREQAESLGRHMILDHVPAAHKQFYQTLPMVFVGVQDEQQRPWATVLFGQPGFMQTPDRSRVVLNTQPHAQDSVAGYLKQGRNVGMLGLDFKLRRRSRLNGQVIHTSKDAIEVDVQQCFVNCPKYIQARSLTQVGFNPLTNEQVKRGQALGKVQVELIRRADTFFIASQFTSEQSCENKFGIDMSHRGGRPGFIKVHEDSVTLEWPDFAGNNMFNTLGNIRRDPRVGLLLIDYERGDILSLTGEAEIVWESAEVEAFEGAERNVRFRVQQWRHLISAYDFDWSEAHLSPFLGSTGTW